MTFHGAHALLVGVGGDLPTTEDDVRALERVLSDPAIAGYPPQNVKVLTGEAANRQSVLKALDQLVEIGKKGGVDTLFVYYSGHGGQYGAGGKSSFYLKTSGYDEQDRNSTMIHGDEFAEKINKIASGRILVILDCCHAAGINRKDNVFSDSDEENILNTTAPTPLIAKLKKGKGKIFMSSCKDDETSLILKGEENSLFTAVLIEALNGANSTAYKYVHAAEVVSYLVRKVPERSTFRGKPRQNPVVDEIKGLDSDFFICANSTHGAEKAADIHGNLLKKEKEAYQPLERMIESINISGNIINTESGEIDNIVDIEDFKDGVINIP